MNKIMKTLAVIAISIWSIPAFADPIFQDPTYTNPIPEDVVTIQYDLQVGDKVYTDRDFTFASIPDELLGLEWLQTANDAKRNGNTLEFDVLVDATLILFVDNRVGPLDWMAPGGWVATGLSAIVTNEPWAQQTYSIYSLFVAAGTTVATGAQSGGSFYGVIGAPYSVPEPGTLALLGLGLAGMGMLRRKKKV